MSCLHLPSRVRPGLRSWIRRIVASTTLAAGLLLPPGAIAEVDPLFVYDFDLGPVPAENVEHVRSLGFSGLVTRCSALADVAKLADYADHVATIEGFRMLAFVNYDFEKADSRLVWRDALPTLSTLGAPLWVIVRNAPSVAEIDTLLLQMATTAGGHGVPLVLYPHWDTDIENAAEAAAYIAQMAHPNVFTSLHSCHEIRSGNQYRMDEVAASNAPMTRLVTIAGADDHAYTGPPPYDWDDAIRPLDRGSYDLFPLLKALEEAHYGGPVILHTWGLAQDVGHLNRSRRAYRDYRLRVIR